MLGIDMRTLLHAFAMASAAPPAAWETTDTPQAVADEAGENPIDLQCATGRKPDADREVTLQHDIKYLRPPRLDYLMGR
jgi:hypothetical protein